MKDLIEALAIFSKYMPKDIRNPTHCEHDVLYIINVDPSEVSASDHSRLDELGFITNDEEDGYMSFRFGSA